MELNELIAQLGETVAAPATAQRVAYVVLINALHAKGLLDRDEVAAQLEATARTMPADVIGLEHITRHLYALAEAIRTSTMRDERSSLQ